MSGSAWRARQDAFVERLRRGGLSELDRGTLVVVPSITFPQSELDKIVAAQFYEERMLFTLLSLRNPDLRVVYVTSVAVEGAVVDYYLRFLPDPEDARRRLHMVDLADASRRPLSAKLVGRPAVLDEMRALVVDPDRAYVLSFNVTPVEQALCEALELPLFGPAPELAPLGSKSGSRRVARRAGVAVLDGDEDLFTVDALEAAVAGIRARRPRAEGVIVKLNNGFSGQGSAVVDLDGTALHLPSSTTFCAEGESWPSYSDKLGAEGAVAEEMVRLPGTASPSVQVRVAPGRSFEILSTHDQVLGGLANQVYVGCRFPADARYRLAIAREAASVARVLAAEGVIGSFGIDFLLVPEGRRGPAGPGDEGGAFRPYVSEVNLRMGGTTHPFWMARLATGATYDAGTGELVAGGRAKSYVSTDNLKAATLVGAAPSSVIEAVDRAGLGFDPVTATGTTLHLLGALPGHGKMGVTCIGDDPAEAADLYRRVTATLAGGPL